MMKSILLALLLTVLPLTPGTRQFTHFRTENSDLSHDGVQVITQDSRGYIWIGTFNGLNRYDGTRFRVYYKEDLGLSSDFIHQIAEDPDGNLWIGTDAGVTCYRYALDRFEPLLTPADNGTVISDKISHISCDSQGMVWILAGFEGCFAYDTRSARLTNYLRGAGKEVACSFRKMLRDPDGGWWLSKYRRNIYHADDSFGSRHAIVLQGEPDWFKGDDVEGMFYFGTDSTRFYTVSSQHGISEVNPAAQTVRTLYSPGGRGIITDVTPDGEKVWISTSEGVICYDFGTGKSCYYGRDGKDMFSLSDSYALTTFVDNNGGLWIGTKDGGVNYSSLDRSNFEIHHRVGDKALSGSVTSGFACDGEGRVWVTTEHAGLLVYDLRSGTLREANIPGLPSTLSMPVCTGGRLWLGSLDGLYRVDLATRALRRYGNLVNKGVDDCKVYVLFKTEDDILYASTTRGVFRYDEDSDSFASLDAFYGIFVTGMAEDKDGIIWMSTFDDGVYAWDSREEKMAGHWSTDGGGLKANKVSSVFVDSADRVWAIGFSSGFYRFDKAAGLFRSICRCNLPALPTNVFFRALEDASRQLWFSSDAGLVRYNPETDDVGVYTELDGLLERKMTNSALRLPEGDMFFGSDNGFIRFHPGRFLAKDEHAFAILTDLSIGDEVIRPSEESPLLPAHLDMLRRITLKAGQNSFGFSFSVLGASFPSTARLQCLLDGYDKDWRDVSTEKSVSYYNVPSGTYSFRVRTASVGGEWHEREGVLKVVVKPPFWASAAGIAIILACILALLSVVFYALERRLKNRQAREVEAFRHDKEEELFQDKMNFFAHVIHEIKTPLTLIRTPLLNLQNSDGLSDDARHDLNVMGESTAYLTSLVNELLDFIRIEKKGYEMHPVTIEVAEKVRMLLFSFADTARDRNLRLEFADPGHPVYVQADNAALDKMLNNLLHNAVKHAESRIDIALEEKDGQMVLTVGNDGPVIPEDCREAIFRPFVQYHSPSGELSEGVGIGLPLSRMLAQMHGGGLILSDHPSETRFVLSLPVGEAPAPDAAAKEELAAEDGSDKPVLLITEDNEDLSAWLQVKLSPDYSIRRAAMADEALTIMKEETVDLLMTDISMPGRSGLDLCRAVREDIEISHIPIIILSARTSVDSKIEAMRSGADLYIEKPFDLEYLRSSIRNIISRRALMKGSLRKGMVAEDISMFGLPKRDEEFFLKLDEVIMKNLDNDDISNEFLAEALSVSQSTLVRKMRKLLGTTPNLYVRSKRLAVAEAMLRDERGNNISEVAYAVGFSNLSWFSKCFREQYGLTPSEYLSRRKR